MERCRVTGPIDRKKDRRQPTIVGRFTNSFTGPILLGHDPFRLCRERHELLHFSRINLDKVRRPFGQMIRHCAKLLRASLMLVAIGGAASAGPFEDAVAAYQRGDYATALRLWHPLAEQGDVQDAKDAYQQAIDSRHADHAPKAARNLQALILQAGEIT